MVNDHKVVVVTVNGRTACSTNCQYCIYSVVNISVLTNCTDQGEISCGSASLPFSSMSNLL